MKREASKEKTGKSPYTKYGKRPFIYSDELNNWTAAAKSGNKERMNHWDRQWKKKFGIVVRPQYEMRGDHIDDFYVDNYR